MLHLCVTTLMANGPGFGFSWVKCNMVLSDAKYTDIGVPLFFVPRIYIFFFCLVYFLFQPVLHDWCNKGCGMCYPVCGLVHIKEPLLLIGKSSPCGGSGFPLSLSEWSFTICPTPYNRKIKCVECVVK